MSRTPEWRSLPGPWWRKWLIFLSAPFLFCAVAIVGGLLVAELVDLVY